MSQLCNFFHFQGGTKVLITGPWFSASPSYGCTVDGVSLSAQFIQSGVLRIVCPGEWHHQVLAHEPTLCISSHSACDEVGTGLPLSSEQSLENGEKISWV
jgi:hypothetical protein